MRLGPVEAGPTRAYGAIGKPGVNPARKRREVHLRLERAVHVDTKAIVRLVKLNGESMPIRVIHAGFDV